MTQKMCDLEHLIDQVDMPEADRAIAKMKARQAETIVNAVASCISGIGKLLKPSTYLKAKAAHQH